MFTKEQLLSIIRREEGRIWSDEQTSDGSHEIIFSVEGHHYMYNYRETPKGTIILSDLAPVPVKKSYQIRSVFVYADSKSVPTKEQKEEVKEAIKDMVVDGFINKIQDIFYKKFSFMPFEGEIFKMLQEMSDETNKEN